MHIFTEKFIGLKILKLPVSSQKTDNFAA